MGDWCGPKSDTDRLKTGARNRRRSNANELIQREKKKILLRRNVRAYLTDRLMGDTICSSPFAPFHVRRRLDLKLHNSYFLGNRLCEVKNSAKSSAFLRAPFALL